MLPVGHVAFVVLALVLEFVELGGPCAESRRESRRGVGVRGELEHAAIED